MAIWNPNIDALSGPKYLRIVQALKDDIASGALPLGARLPAHRDLAYALGLSPQTTSRAYAEAARRLLVRGEVGRGTFVSDPSRDMPSDDATGLVRHSSGPIDLSRNLPHPGLAGERLAQTCAELGRRGSLDALTDYQAETDMGRFLQAGISWLDRHQISAEPATVVITNGAQHAIFCALMASTRPGDQVIVESLTYAPIKAMADRLGLKLVTVATDGAGPCLDDLERLCREEAVKVMYLTPTLRTPTGHTQDRESRRAIAQILRRTDVLLLEDDVFGLMHPSPPEPIATLAPERTIFITSTSKLLAPGLRVGFLHAPPDLANTIRRMVSLTCWMTPPLMVEIASRWIGDGTVDEFIDHQRRNARRRQTMAAGILQPYLGDTPRCGTHLWLELPDRWEAVSFCLQLSNRGVHVTPGGAFSATPRAASIPPRAIRLCLSHEASDSRMEQALQIIRDELDQEPKDDSWVL